MPKHVVILGAGLAGLSAGWQFAREGIQVDILEMDPCVGGLCRSTSRDNFIFDLGGHRFITKNNLLLTELKKLMGGELMVRSRKSAIRLQGKFFSYPLELIDVLTKLNPWISFKSGLDLLLTKLRTYSKMPDVSFENWIIKRFGRMMYDIYFRPYSHKLWGIPPMQISSLWAAQRISLINITDVFLRALGKKKNIPKTYTHNFFYPKKGIGQISERMAEEIKKIGEVHLNAKIKKIILKNSQIEKVIYIQDNKEKEISGDFVVSTIPLPEFILSIEPKVEDRYLSIAKAMKYRSIKFLHLMLNIEQVTNNTWIYVPEEKYCFFRIQDRRNWSPTVVPDGKNALTLEIACNKNEPIWNACDEEIFEQCIKGLEELELITRSAVTDYFTEKKEHAYPIYSLDYQEKIRITYEFLSGIKDFVSIGRQGLFQYNNMDHSMGMGLRTVDYLLSRCSKEEIFQIGYDDTYLG